MAQTWGKSLLAMSGCTNPISRKTGFQRSGVVTLSCTGPVSSVQAGSIIDVSTWLPNTCHGMSVVAREGGSIYDLDLEYEPAASYAPATGKIVAVRRSTGVRVTSNVDLSGQKFILEFVGS